MQQAWRLFMRHERAGGMDGDVKSLGRARAARPSRDWRECRAPFYCASAGSLTGSAFSSRPSTATVTPGPICCSETIVPSFSATPS